MIWPNTTAPAYYARSNIKPFICKIHKFMDMHISSLYVYIIIQRPTIWNVKTIGIGADRLISQFHQLSQTARDRLGVGAIKQKSVRLKGLDSLVSFQDGLPASQSCITIIC